MCSGCSYTVFLVFGFGGMFGTGVPIIGPVGIGEVQMTTFFLQNKIFVKNEF